MKLNDVNAVRHMAQGLGYPTSDLTVEQAVKLLKDIKVLLDKALPTPYQMEDGFIGVDTSDI